jgi:hypothetical protein
LENFAMQVCTRLLVVLASIAGFGGMATAQPPAAPPAERKDPAPADPHADLSETVGLLSGLYLYQAYLNIGLLADGKAVNTYDDKAARSVLDSVLTPLETVDKQFEKLSKSARTQADRDACDRLRGVVTLLRRQGADLKAFWNSGQPEDGAKYEASRQEAWKQISALLGFNKK